MPKTYHPCLLCGKYTTAKSQICKGCSSKPSVDKITPANEYLLRSGAVVLNYPTNRDRNLDDYEGDLIVIQKELLPDAKGSLAWLTSPDYKPENNPDHDLRDMDLENLQREITKLEAEERRLIERMARRERYLLTILQRED